MHALNPGPTIGNKIPLMTDVNCAWTYEEILEKKSFLEQVSIFYNAKVVVGAHGAGLANICFSKSKSRIIEIRSSEPGYAYQNREYERIAKILEGALLLRKGPMS